MRCSKRFCCNMWNTNLLKFWLTTSQDAMHELSGTGTITISQDHHVIITQKTLGQLVNLCWFLQFFYLLIWELFGFFLFFYQLKLGLSVFSIHDFHWIPSTKWWSFSTGRKSLKGRSVMYWNIVLVEERWTWNFDSKFLEMFLSLKSF